MRHEDRDPSRSAYSFRSRDCSRLRRLLDDYLSEELAVESNRDILVHLERCEPCRRELKLRRRLRGRLAEAWTSRKAPSGLEGRIHESMKEPTSWWRRPPAWAAALLLLLFGSGLLFWTVSTDESFPRRSAHYDLFSHVVQDHYYCMGAPPPRDKRLPLDGVSSEMERSLAAGGDAYRLVSASLCELGGYFFIHYTFDSQEEHRLSVMLQPLDDGVSSPLSGEEVRSLVDGLPLFLTRRKDAGVAYLESPGYLVYVVGEETVPGRTEELAGRLIPSLRSALYDLALRLASLR